MTNTQTDLHLDRTAFDALTLAWFREGDELADTQSDNYVEYINESSGLRRSLGRASLALGSVAMGVLALTWLVG